jgi:hypothetical protein
MLKYIGAGDFRPGLPACDVSDEMLAEGGWSEADLLATGLYVTVGGGDKAGTENDNDAPMVLDLSDGVSDKEARMAGKALQARKRK